MMNAILEERYFEWLYGQINDPDIERQNLSYWNLARQLHNKEFVYIVANDDNRWVDGRRLREEFLEDWDEETIPEVWISLACSMLEMLIALSRRLEFQTDDASESWFWILIRNLDLFKYSDLHYNKAAREDIDDVLDTVIWRKYSYSGEGGLFPLQRADMDQRQLEIWFQMHTYLLANL